MRIDLRGGPAGGVSLPPAHLISDPEIVAALTAYQAAKHQRGQAHDEAFHFERTRPSAVESDATALADSLDAGEGDPGSVNVQAFEVKLADLKRHAEALDLLSARRLSELREALDGDGVGAWVSELEEVREQRRQAWQEAIDHLLVAHAALAETDALIAFTRRGSFHPPGPIEVIEPRRDATVGEALGILRRHGAALAAVESAA